MVLNRRISRAVIRFMTTSEQEQWALEETSHPARLIGFRQRAPASIGDLGIGNALGGDTVFVVDIIDPHQAVQANELIALVQAQPLLTPNGQYTVGHHF